MEGLQEKRTTRLTKKTRLPSNALSQQQTASCKSVKCNYQRAKHNTLVIGQLGKGEDNGGRA